jgi:transcriptional regulator with XRE-family HTH domain
MRVVIQNEDHNVPTAGDARTCLANNLRELRAQRGLSQEYLAFEAGLHRTFIAHVERGARNISIDNIEKLAIALGVPTYRLLMGPKELPGPQNMS